MSKKTKTLNKLAQITLRLASAAFIIGAAGALDASDAVKETLGSEGGKEVLTEALKVARGKPALALAAVIVCIGCFPAAGVAGSASMCIVCGIFNF